MAHRVSRADFLASLRVGFPRAFDHIEPDGASGEHGEMAAFCRHVRTVADSGDHTALRRCFDLAHWVLQHGDSVMQHVLRTSLREDLALDVLANDRDVAATTSLMPAALAAAWREEQLQLSQPTGRLPKPVADRDTSGIAGEIIASDNRDRVVGICRWRAASVADAAAHFGLLALPNALTAVGLDDARTALTNVLWKGQVFQEERLQRHVAERLAARFLEQFADEAAVYYCNRAAPEIAAAHTWSPWSPLTSATFDTGILVVTPTRTGCAWFIEED